MFSTILLLYILFFTELFEATSSRKDGSSNSSIWLSWVETFGYDWSVWHVPLLTSTLSSYYIQYHFSSLLCRGFTVRPRSPLCEVSVGAKWNHHPLSGSLPPVKKPLRRRGCHASLLRLLSHPSRYSQYLVLLIGKDTLPAVSRRSWLFSCRLY